MTGASRGIGLAVTQALAKEGLSVAAGARTLTDDLSKLAADYPVRPVQVDLTTQDGPEALVEEAVATFGGLDVLVNNVGAVRPRPAGFLSVTDDEWTWSLTINFLAAVRTTRAALPHMFDRGAGSIVTTCSVNAILPDPLVIDYSAAKGALANFSKALSKEAGPPRCPRQHRQSWPGRHRPVAGRRRPRQYGRPSEQERSRCRRQASGQWDGDWSVHRPEEVADLVVLLASERAGNVTGADFVIDGGLVQTL